MPRYAKFTVVVGGRGSGKTRKTVLQIYTGVKKGRKGLLYDINDEFGKYEFTRGEAPHSITPLFIKDVKRFSLQTFPEVRRIRPLLDDGTLMDRKQRQSTLAEILKTYRDGILLVEDPHQYISDNAPDDVLGKLATLRQAGVDVIIHFQMVKKAANPSMIGLANFIRLHKTTDSVARCAEGFGEHLDIMLIAEKIVERRYYWGVKNKVQDDTGQFFSVTIDLDCRKIRGIFTKSEAEFAIEHFLGSSNSPIRELLNQLDREGRKIWPNYSAAYKHLEARLMDTYFVF